MLKCNIDIKALVWSSYRLYFDGDHPAGEQQVVAHSRSEHNQLFRKLHQTLHHTFSLHLHILYSHCTIFQLEHGLGAMVDALHAQQAFLPAGDAS